MWSTFSMEIFPHFAVGFWWNGQDASRTRIFSWSAILHENFQFWLGQAETIGLFTTWNYYFIYYFNPTVVLNTILIQPFIYENTDFQSRMGYSKSPGARLPWIPHTKFLLKFTLFCCCLEFNRILFSVKLSKLFL